LREHAVQQAKRNADFDAVENDQQLEANARRPVWVLSKVVP